MSRKTKVVTLSVTTEEVKALADRVLSGDEVETDLNDGSLVAVLQELRQRGYGLAQRSEIERYWHPFLLKVERTHDDDKR